MRGYIIFVLLLWGSISYSKADCPFGHMKCTSSDKCVPLSWKCDGDADCEDKSDEQGCPAKTCAETEFVCEVNGTCIPERWKCDGELDCDNGEDENPKVCDSEMGTCPVDQFSCKDGNCININWVCDSVEDCENGLDEKNCTKTCDPGMYTCGDGQCISSNWHCDGDADCTDGSDEKDCENKECESGEFPCKDGSRCIDKKWMCDGDFDCADHSDESTNCNYTNPDTEICSETEFKCVLEGECIHNSWECDGDPDCTDGSDEGSHCNYSCKGDQFMCENHVCISNTLRCDHNNDCTDGSDEKECPYHQNCTARGEFDCYGDGTQCIPMDHVCDGFNDCEHREDEDPAICKLKDPCVDYVCGEHSHCVKNTITHNHVEASCQCNSGFKMQEGHCKDIDECVDPSMCSHTCINTKGGYKCECLEGYTLERHHYCRANGESAWLYYTNRRDIRRLRSDTSFMEIVVEETGNSVGLDMDIKDSILFWTDNRDSVIKKASIPGRSVLATNEKTVVQRNPEDDFSSDGLAVDWLYKKIYWTESHMNKIMVADYNGEKHKTLVSGNLHDPRAIAVDPEEGYVYWTDWGKDAKIERCGMDGQGRKVLLDGDMLGWPNGLTIDYVSKRLFWIDAKLHKIGSMKLDGSDVKYIFEDAKEIQRPFAIAVFEDSLYWTDWSTNTIKSVHKMTGLSPKTLNIGSYSVMDIKVYHGLRQNTAQAEKTKSRCAAKNCDFMCLAAPSVNGTAAVSCVCGDDSTLNPDGRTCSAAAPRPTTPKTATTEKPEQPKPAATTEKPEQPKPAATTEKPEQPQPASTDGHGGYSVPDSTTTKEGGGQKEPQSVGGIAAITAIVVSVIIISVGVVGCLVVRKYRMKNKKSMNFDNPVYRKTTTSDEQCMINNDEPQMEPFVKHHEDV